MYELSAPQIRGVRAAGTSNTRCMSCWHLKYAVYELTFGLGLEYSSESDGSRGRLLSFRWHIGRTFAEQNLRLRRDCVPPKSESEEGEAVRLSFADQWAAAAQRQAAAPRLPPRDAWAGSPVPMCHCSCTCATVIKLKFHLQDMRR